MRLNGSFCRRGAPALLAALWLAAASGRTQADAQLFVPGAEADGPSIAASLSADGRFVAFASEATNLVPGDRNNLQDIFVHDRQTGETTRVSIGPGGIEADGYSELPAFSADGRFVAFQSVASNLVSLDNNMESDVFVYDRQTGLTERVSVASDGAQAAGPSWEPAISADGRYVAFTSAASNLDGPDDNFGSDIYVHDRQTGETELISVSSTEQQGLGDAQRPAISAGGRYVAFSSWAGGLVANDDNEVEDIFVRDRQAGTTTRVSVRGDGGEATAESYDPSLSADGRFVAFWSYDGDLGAEPGGSLGAVYVHDRQTGATGLVSRGADAPADSGSSLPAISDDGRYVAFESGASNLTPGDNNAASDVFLYDRQTDEVARLSLGAVGGGNAESHGPAIAAGGRAVAFDSRATNLVAHDRNGVVDIFVRDRAAGATDRVSLASAAAPPQPSRVYLGYISR